MQQNYYNAGPSLTIDEIWHRAAYYCTTSKYKTGISSIDNLWSEVPLE